MPLRSALSLSAQLTAGAAGDFFGNSSLLLNELTAPTTYGREAEVHTTLRQCQIPEVQKEPLKLLPWLSDHLVSRTAFHSQATKAEAEGGRDNQGRTLELKSGICLYM